MQKFCLKCGKPLNERVEFCGNCGAPTSNAKQQATQTPSQKSAPQNASPVQPFAVFQPQSQNSAVPVPPAAGPYDQRQAGKVSPQSRSLPLPVIITVVALLAAAIILALVFFLQPPSSSQPSQIAVTLSSSTGQSPSAPQFSNVSVSSQLEGDDDTKDYGASNLVDGVPETAWNEGVEGDGTGESFTLSSDTPQHVSAVSIMGGFPKIYKDGSDVYAKNNRPREITISYDGGSERFTMEDLRGQYQTFKLSKPVDTKFITVTINSVYKGNKYDECCVAEVKVS